MKFLYSVILFSGMLFVCSCKTNTKSQEVIITDFAPPPTIIYKTTKDYGKNVPVILSSDKSKIVSYPHPKDLYYNGQLAYPTVLDEYFLLDNRGIGPDVAFLSYTYEEYSKLTEAPSLQDLFSKIIDKEPLKEMYNCGNRQLYQNGVDEFNKLIKSKGLEKCKRLK